MLIIKHVRSHQTSNPSSAINTWTLWERVKLISASMEIIGALGSGTENTMSRELCKLRQVVWVGQATSWFQMLMKENEWQQGWKLHRSGTKWSADTKRLCVTHNIILFGTQSKGIRSTSGAWRWIDLTVVSFLSNVLQCITKETSLHLESMHACN